MYVPETIPCIYCGDPTTYLGTKQCDHCHNVTSCFSRFISKPEGLKYVLSKIPYRCPIPNEPKLYDWEFGDNRICVCGHPYYRHFDTHEEMDPVGCKYCDCEEFHEKA